MSRSTLAEWEERALWPISPRNALKMDAENNINDYQTLQKVLNQFTQAKNALSIRHGYAPEVIVFGRHTQVPGSVLSDESIPSHAMATGPDTVLGAAEFKQMLQLRESARTTVKHFGEQSSEDRVLTEASMNQTNG